MHTFYLTRPPWTLIVLPLLPESWRQAFFYVVVLLVKAVGRAGRGNRWTEHAAVLRKVGKRNGYVGSIC